MTTRRPIRMAGIALVAALCGCAAPTAAPAPTLPAMPAMPASPASPTAAAPASPSRSAPAASVPPHRTTTTAPPSRITTTREPSLPPRDPTDKIKNTGWVVGTVTAGGEGPCYGLITDDGTRYALHADDGPTLVQGARMRVLTATARVRIACGPGRLVEMRDAEPVG